MVKFIICSDSDIPPADIVKCGIDLLPLIVALDGVEYRAYRDIDGESFRRLLKNTNSFPKTATVSSVEIADKMRIHIENGDELVFVAMSSKGSGTFNIAHIAKDHLEEQYGCSLPIGIVDSLNFSLGYLHPIYDAVEMSLNGKNYKEIVDFLNIAYSKQQFIVMITDLSYLKNGGRIKPSAALVGGILGITPILHVKDGVVEVLCKKRGTTKAIGAITQFIEEKCNSKNIRRAQLLQCNREKEAIEIEDLIKNSFEVKEFLPTTRPEASVTAHIGMDFVGIAFVEG
jgi:DegV family protein with EDD domain